MADKPEYVVIYHSDHDGEPLALVRSDLPGNHATEMVKAAKMLGGGQIHVAGADSTAMKRNADVADLFAAGPASPETGAAAPNPDEPGSTADPDAVLRAEIRTRLDREERVKQIEAEVRKVMAADKRESKD